LSIDLFINCSGSHRIRSDQIGCSSL
jgi:hypothetical protein